MCQCGAYDHDSYGGGVVNVGECIAGELPGDLSRSLPSDTGLVPRSSNGAEASLLL